jgi:hypothetical protein
MKRAGRLALIAALLALAACDANQRVGGRFESGGQQPFLQTGVKTTVTLVLGQYAGEVAGHLLLPGLNDCTCVYVRGTFQGDTLEFVTDLEPSSATCAGSMQMSGRFDLSEDELSGKLFQGPGWETALTDTFSLEHVKTQRELTLADDLRGCGGGE